MIPQSTISIRKIENGWAVDYGYEDPDKDNHWINKVWAFTDPADVVRKVGELLQA